MMIEYYKVNDWYYLYFWLVKMVGLNLFGENKLFLDLFKNLK